MAFNYVGMPLAAYEAVDKAITQRPTATALLCIDSEDRFKSYTESRDPGDAWGNRSPYNFTIQRAENLMTGYFTRLGVSEVVFPWVIPNINRRTFIIQITYKIGAAVPVITTVTLPIGFYTPAQLATALQTRIRTLDAGLAAFTLIYGTAPPDLTSVPLFEYDTNVPGNLVSFQPVPVNPVLGITTKSKQLFDILGFTTNNQILVQASGGGITYCQPTRYVDIVCSQLVYNQALKDTTSQIESRDMLCRLYVAEPSMPANVAPTAATFCPPGCAPFTIYRNFTTPKMIAWLPNQPVGGALSFQVYDDNGELLSEADSFGFYNQGNWSMTLLVSEN